MSFSNDALMRSNNSRENRAPRVLVMERGGIPGWKINETNASPFQTTADLKLSLVASNKENNNGYIDKENYGGDLKELVTKVQVLEAQAKHSRHVARIHAQLAKEHEKQARNSKIEMALLQRLSKREKFETSRLIVQVRRDCELRLTKSRENEEMALEVSKRALKVGEKACDQFESALVKAKQYKDENTHLKRKFQKARVTLEIALLKLVLKSHVRRLHRGKNCIANQKEEIQGLDDIKSKRKKQIQDLEAIEAELEVQIQELEDIKADQKNQIQDQKATLIDQKKQIQALQAFIVALFGFMLAMLCVTMLKLQHF